MVILTDTEAESLRKLLIEIELNVDLAQNNPQAPTQFLCNVREHTLNALKMLGPDENAAPVVAVEPAPVAPIAAAQKRPVVHLGGPQRRFFAICESVGQAPDAPEIYELASRITGREMQSRGELNGHEWYRLGTEIETQHALAAGGAR